VYVIYDLERADLERTNVGYETCFIVPRYINNDAIPCSQSVPRCLS